MNTRTADIRHWAVWAGKLLLAVLLLILLLQQLQTSTLIETYAAAQFPWLVAAVFLLLPNLYFQYSKWRLLLRGAYPAVEPADIRSSLLLGFTFGIVTPARIGEFGGRAAAVRDADRLTLVGLTAVDKLATMTVTVGAGALGLLLFCIQHPFMPPWQLAGIEGMVAAVVIIIAMLRRSRPPAAETAERDGFFSRHIDRLRRALRTVDRKTRSRLLLLSSLFYATFVLQFYFLLCAFAPIDPLSALAGIATIMLVKTLVPPLTLGELGIREGASVLVLGYAGIVGAVALGASLLLFAINILIPGLAGVAILLRRPVRSTA